MDRLLDDDWIKEVREGRAVVIPITGGSCHGYEHGKAWWREGEYICVDGSDGEYGTTDIPILNINSDKALSNKESEPNCYTIADWMKDTGMDKAILEEYNKAQSTQNTEEK